MKRIGAELTSALRTPENPKGLQDLRSRLERYAENGKLTTSELNSIVVAEWERGVDRFLDDGVLDTQEEAQLVLYRDHFGLDQNDLDRHGAYSKLAKGGALREPLGGVLPERMQIKTQLPFNFVKGEQLVWAFADTTYLEDKVKRTYVGGSQGVSIRIAKGVYYRTSSYKGTSVESTVRDVVDRGLFAITNKNLYFAGPRKSLRVPLAKIVTFDPFKDGIGIVRDAANAKTQVFVTGDGWFTHNLVVNLARFGGDA